MYSRPFLVFLSAAAAAAAAEAWRVRGSSDKERSGRKECSKDSEWDRIRSPILDAHAVDMYLLFISTVGRIIITILL